VQHAPSPALRETMVPVRTMSWPCTEFLVQAVPVAGEQWMRIGRQADQLAWFSWKEKPPDGEDIAGGSECSRRKSLAGGRSLAEPAPSAKKWPGAPVTEAV
jgi:hypothetical protein